MLRKLTLFCTLPLLGCSSTDYSPFPLEPASADNVRLISRDTGDDVPLDRLESEAAVEPVFLSVSDTTGQMVDFFGRDVHLDRGSLVLLGTGTDALYAAVVRGSAGVTQGGRRVQAGPGELILWRADRSGPQRRVFDMKRFRDSLDATVVDSLDGFRGSADSTADAQSRRLRWGLLRPTPFNALSPTDRDTTLRRQRYLNRPTVVRLRFESSDPATLSQNTARVFAEGLAEGDADVVADLLDPVFLDLDRDQDERADGPDTSEDETVRALVARTLAGDGRDDLQVETMRPGRSANTYFFQSTRPDIEGYLLTLRPGDGLFFVAGFTPAEAGE
jgi:hypothetical protein